jgi:hypothetical protein
MTARGDSLGYSRNPGSNYYAGLTHQLMIDLDADDAARVSAFHFAVGRQSRWQTTTGCSVPALRFGTLALAVGAACGLSLHADSVTKHRFSRSIRKPGRASRRLHAGCRSGRIRASPELIPEEGSPPGSDIA